MLNCSPRHFFSIQMDRFCVCAHVFILKAIHHFLPPATLVFYVFFSSVSCNSKFASYKLLCAQHGSRCSILLKTAHIITRVRVWLTLNIFFSAAVCTWLRCTHKKDVLKPPTLSDSRWKWMMMGDGTVTAPIIPTRLRKKETSNTGIVAE